MVAVANVQVVCGAGARRACLAAEQGRLGAGKGQNVAGAYSRAFAVSFPGRVHRQFVAHWGGVTAVRFTGAWILACAARGRLLTGVRAANGRYCVTCGGSDRAVRLWNPYRPDPARTSDLGDSALQLHEFAGMHGYDIRDVAM